MKRKYLKIPTYLCLSGILAGLVGITNIALAQTSADDEEENKVIELDPFEVNVQGRDRYLATNQIGGTRMNMPIQNIPLSIQIVPDTLIEDLAVYEVEDSLKFVSGVSLTNRNDLEDAGESYVIRGFGTRMLLRNGILYNAWTESINILQIEVVKGPSSVLYGVSDPGGIVNVVTKQPQDEPYYYAGATVGKWDFYRAEFDFTSPIDKEKMWSYRLMGSYDSYEGFRPFVDDQTWFINGMLSFRPTKNHRFLIDYAEGFENNQASSRRGYPLLREGSVRSFPDLGYDFTMATPFDYQDLKQSFVEARWEAKWSDNLKSRFSYMSGTRNNDKFSNAQASIRNGRFNKVPQREKYEVKDENIYFDLLANYEIGNSSHTTLIGLQQRTEELVFFNYLWGADFGGPLGPAVLFNEDLTGFDPAQSVEERYWMPPLSEMIALDGFNPSRNQEKVEGYFISHQARFLDDRLHIMGGLRHDRMREIDVQHTTPQVGINYAVVPGLHVYASYNESFVPNTMVDETTGQIYDPEEGEGYDIGFKFELFDRKLVGTFAYFVIEKSNVVLFNARRDPGDPEFILSGLARNEGVEMDLVYSPNKNMQVIFAFANHDARELENSQFPDQTGLRLQGSAKNSLGIWTKYMFDDGKLSGLSVGGGVEWKEGPIRLFPNGNNRDLIQDTYSTVDLFARYSIPLENDREVSIAVNLKNVTDEIYMNKNGWWADPFSWSVSLRYTY